MLVKIIVLTNKMATIFYIGERQDTNDYKNHAENWQKIHSIHKYVAKWGYC